MHSFLRYTVAHFVKVWTYPIVKYKTAVKGADKLDKMGITS